MTLSEYINITKERRQEDTRRELLTRFVQAMREDLSEWINSLSYNADLTPDNFLPGLDNGVILCQQARLIQRFAEEYAVLNPNENLKIPTKPVRYTEKGAFSGSFIARDNVSNYIAWCKELGIQDVVIFESEDLVLHKNEKSVILSLMDVARKAYKFGVRPPEIVRFEKEIDEEIERDEECEKAGKVQPKPRDLEEDNNLDVLVRNIVNKCICEDRFPIKKLAEGKYKIGKTHTLIFVRVMRKHVMVRIGGGWDTLDHYIVKHDPCRTIVAGNIENGSPQTALSKAKNIAQQKVAALAKEKFKSLISQASSDTQSMCSESTNSSGSLDDCHPTSIKNATKLKETLNEESQAIEDFLNESAINMDQSIQEIDNKLKELEKTRNSINTTPKDISVYENKADRWLRSQMNSLKGSKTVLEKPSEDLSRGTQCLGNTPEKRNSTPNAASDGGITVKTKSISRNLFKNSVDSVNIYSVDSECFELNHCLCMKSSSQTNVCYSHTATQTDCKIPIRSKTTNGHSRIPIFQRSRTADAILRNSVEGGLPRMRKRNLAEDSQKLIQDRGSPKLTKEKSDLTSNTSRRRDKSNSVSQLPFRREKSDLTSSKSSLRREKSDLTSKFVLKREKSNLSSKKRTR